MLSTPVFISNSDGPFSSNQYTLNLTFQDSSRAPFLYIGDQLKDSSNNIYSIVNLSLPFVNGQLLTVQYVNNNTLPVVDTIIYGSIAYTPGVQSYAAAYQALGTINSQSVHHAYLYEWNVNITCAFPILQVQLGDQLLDANGTAFNISYIDSLLGFASMRIVESIKIGHSPALGACSIYRSTSPSGFFQGLAPNSAALLAAQERDIARIDGLISTPGPQGLTGIQGDTGVLGETGIPGIAGATGTHGVQGATGLRGANGATGRSGEDGATGVRGIVGSPGHRGQQGITGISVRGATGLQGLQGSTGVGTRGLQGNQGYPGETGTQGSPGHPGVTGSRGGQGLNGATGPAGSTHTPKKEKVILQSLDVTNQYINLAYAAIPDSLCFSVKGVIKSEGTDYSLAIVGGTTRITFSGDLASGGHTPLFAGETVSAQYLY